MAWRACFVAAYVPPMGPVTSPASDVTFTIVPLPRSRIWGSTAWIMRTAPSTFVSNMRRIWSIGTRSIAPWMPKPALLTNTSTVPALATASATDASSSTSRRSVWVTSRSSSVSGRRAVASTSWPRFVSSTAAARPNPVEQPVMRTRAMASPCRRRRRCRDLVTGDALERLEHPFDVGVVDVLVGREPYCAGVDRARPDALGVEPVEQVARETFGDRADHVGLDGVGRDRARPPLGDGFGEPPRPAGVVAQPVEHQLHGDPSGRC